MPTSGRRWPWTGRRGLARPHGRPGARPLPSRTAPFIRASAGAAGKSEPVDNAVGLLRELADACALHSYDWSPEERATLRIPTRAALESNARLYGVDSWVTGLGHPLELAAAGHAGGGLAHRPRRLGANLGARPGRALQRGRGPLRRRAGGPHGRARMARAAGRGVPQRRVPEVAVARGWLLWTTGFLGPEALPVAHAKLLMAQMFFVASRDATFEEVLFPSEEFLQQLLGATGATAWLQEHGATLPEWLA